MLQLTHKHTVKQHLIFLFNPFRTKVITAIIREAIFVTFHCFTLIAMNQWIFILFISNFHPFFERYFEIKILKKKYFFYFSLKDQRNPDNFNKEENVNFDFKSA